MSQQLINHSPDLKRLRDEGYEVEVKGGYLLCHHIPYVNANQQIQFGTLVTELTLSGNMTAKPSYHVIYFTGEHPCDRNGRIIAAIQYQTLTQVFLDGVIVHHGFSNKPPEGYLDYYHKITRYADIISAPAKAIDSQVTERTFKVIPTVNDESVFQYVDTNASRANIHRINDKLSGQRVAIVGMGGTGGYIIDMIAKTPVAELHAYDGDVLQTHNAFRSPGAASLRQLEQQPMKAEYYAETYAKMHRRVVSHPYYVDEATLNELSQMDFVFVCVDKNSVRELITNYLVSQQIAFIDVGLGVNVVDNSLIGMVRVTAATRTKNDHLSQRLPTGAQGDNEYATNIQVAELNALNAVLAVIKWKKLSGFYQDLENEHHSLYSVPVSEVYNEDRSLAA